MRIGKIIFTYFDKGDFVRTPDGVGIVHKDEPEVFTARELHDSDIIVQHKFGNSNNTSNQPIDVERSYLIRIKEEEYNEETEIC